MKELRIEENRIVGAQMDDADRPIVPVAPDPEILFEYLVKKCASDGLPVIPPTKEKVEKALEYSYQDSEKVVCQVPPRLIDLTVWQLAANTVMAGCRPEYFPVVLAAFEAMSQESFNLRGIVSTTAPVWPGIIVNGPYSRQIGMNSGLGALGPGNRANATIGRAITLTLFTVGGAYPGLGKMANVWHPGAYICNCFAENEGENPWEPLHVERGFNKDDSTVTMVPVVGTMPLLEQSTSGLDLLICAAYQAAQPALYTGYQPGEVILALSPQHVQRLSKDGWSKKDIQEFMYENSRLPIELIRTRGAGGGGAEGGQIRLKGWPKWAYADGARVPVMKTPKDAVIVAVGEGTGKNSTIIFTWGWIHSITKAINLK